MKKILFTLTIFTSSLLFSQAVPSYQTRADLVLQTNIESYDSDLVGYGLKRTGTTLANNALTYLVNKYKSFGYDEATQISYDTFSYSTANDSKNLIVTKTGTVYPDEYIIICGHYDSYYGTTNSNRSVGANDNGTGVSVILEAARILKDVPTEYSIKFINFTGEEQGLLGSKNYVNNVVNATTPKMKIRLVFNLDMIGGVKAQTNNSVFCEADRLPNSDGTFNSSGTTQGTKTTNDLTSHNFTQNLIKYVGYYSTLTPVQSYAYNSDYMPFENNGEIITGLYERPTNTSSGAVIDPNPYYHKNTDVLTNVSFPYVTQIAKAVVGAIQHFAIASTSSTLSNEEAVKNNLKIYPNPVKDIINININSKITSTKIYDNSGKLILENKESKTIDASSLAKGNYVISIESNEKIYSDKFIKE